LERASRVELIEFVLESCVNRIENHVSNGLVSVVVEAALAKNIMLVGALTSYALNLRPGSHLGM